MRLHFLAIVIVAGAAAGACARQPPPPQYAGDPGAPGAYGYAPEVSEHFCTAMATPAAMGSICFADPARCDSERQRAAADGARADECRPQAPVACFQLRGEPSPSMEMCAATVEDCELLRLIDSDKNGKTGAACDWRHGPGPGAPR